MTYLVGGVPTPLKNMNVSWDYYSQYMEKSKMIQNTNQMTYDNIRFIMISNSIWKKLQTVIRVALSKCRQISAAFPANLIENHLTIESNTHLQWSICEQSFVSNPMLTKNV